MPCPTNTSVRTIIFFGTEFIGHRVKVPSDFGNGRRVQRTLVFGPYSLRTLLYAGHGEWGGGGAAPLDAEACLRREMVHHVPGAVTQGGSTVPPSPDLCTGHRPPLPPLPALRKRLSPAVRIIVRSAGGTARGSAEGAVQAKGGRRGRGRRGRGRGTEGGGAEASPRTAPQPGACRCGAGVGSRGVSHPRTPSQAPAILRRGGAATGRLALDPALTHGQGPATAGALRSAPRDLFSLVVAPAGRLLVAGLFPFPFFFVTKRRPAVGSPPPPPKPPSVALHAPPQSCAEILNWLPDGPRCVFIPMPPRPGLNGAPPILCIVNAQN